MCNCVVLFWLAFCVKFSFGIFCFNCSSTHYSWIRCGGELSNNIVAHNKSHRNVVNCTADNSVCYVRSWTARAKHAWIVQRGCYDLNREDSLPFSLPSSTRSMTCQRHRFPNAEYKVCFCQADRCNGTTYIGFDNLQFILLIVMVFKFS